MQVATALVLICELCLAIRVPNAWDDSASEVKQEIKNDNDEQFSVESFKPQNVNPDSERPVVPNEYFEYTAKKPQFAVDVAKFHGVQSPENHYSAYPIKPHTGKVRPELGKHHILDKGNKLHRPLQEYTKINEDPASHAVPVSSNYEVFHPYSAETPALQEIYKDPVLTKIRSDLENSKTRLQNYEKEAGEPDIHKDEYLESPQKTDKRFFPHRNVPAQYEIHRPQRRPIYYRPVPKHNHREQHLNQRLRHPWNQYSAKIRPAQYRPIKNHIHHLRQNHALKYDDDRNEYPQVQILENYSDPKDGYDIYEKGKEKFTQLRNNVDESINKAAKENRPAKYEKLEMQNSDHSDNDNNEDEFVPIKNYAQVRKTEVFKHLPREAAFEDADSFDEIRNAPRLREAVKSTKAQTVYSEEGYEDSAYDHAGEQKHASENEGHGGYLKQHELSGGKYKTPSQNAQYQDDAGSASRDQLIHAEKWKNDNKDNKEEKEKEEYSEDEHEKSVEGDEYENSSSENGHRNKRENEEKINTNTELMDSKNKDNETYSSYLDVGKQTAKFKVPELDLNSTFLSEQDYIKPKKVTVKQQKEDIKQKYPYYFKTSKNINMHSPLRYAENLKFIPNKSKGGTEFYDSRSKFECPEVEDIPDPIPEKLKRDGHPDDTSDEDDEDSSSSSTKGDENYDTAKKTPRLNGLGDKIDCFKAKYFGENPLDSPFFKEDIISNPEPVTVPNLKSYKLKTKDSVTEQTKEENVKIDSTPDLFDLIEKLRNEANKSQDSFAKGEDLPSVVENLNSNNKNNDHLGQQSSVYSDVLNNIRNDLKGEVVPTQISANVTKTLTNTLSGPLSENVTYSFYKNKEDVTKAPLTLRKKRSTPFVYEPYKIIRDSQVPDSKKTTTTNNISPLIRQLQSSRVVDIVAKPNQEVEQPEKHVKRNVNTRVYKDIGRQDREAGGSKNDKGIVDSDLIEVTTDKRRGEPRYEVIHTNHKSRYTPVENKKSMSVDDYKARTFANRRMDPNSRRETGIRRQSRQRTSAIKTDSDSDGQNIAASNNVHKTISTSTTKPLHETTKHNEEESESEEDYEDYDEDDDDEETTTTTTTTKRTIIRKKIRSSTTTTTEKLPESTERPKLKLVTRFRDYRPDESSEIQEKPIETPETKNHKVKIEQENKSDELIPKYREKKKKSTKSTIVTDTKRYGDEDDDMQKEEVDAMIGVKQDMDDYMPLYEKEGERKLVKKPFIDEDNYEQHDDEDNDEEDHDDDEEDSEEDDDEDEEEENEDEENNEPELPVTTPEPTKRSLVITTDAPAPTSATRNSKLEIKPVVTRKKLEIHKELPVNKSFPHITQYKQDIKEVEIVKEMPTTPKRKPQKNLEALELYKDDNLAKDINKLGGVEIFKEDIDLKNGPRHGGNYRSLEEPTPAPIKENKNKATKEDAVASQSEFTRHIELDDSVPKSRMHGGNLRSIGDVQKSRPKGKSSKLVEINNTPPQMHGGNLKRGRGRKSEKLIELDEEHDHEEDDSSSSHESFSNSRNSRPMHGGNYRSAKIVEPSPVATGANRSRGRGERRNSAALLNSFAQAVPILTTTPAYILDPSKRMYYYVDA